MKCVWCILLTLSLEAALTNTRMVYRTNRKGRSSAAPIRDILKTTTNFVEETGRIVERHEVTTEDGYINTVHRIPAKKLNVSKVAMVVHGIGATSDNWLLYPSRGLPTVLADEGYDVWVTDFRGNSYSTGHTKFTQDNPRYWRFSFHETGYYDLPAFIDYALNVTEAKDLFILAHSMGTTSSYVLLSSRPEYNDKVRLLLNYAPVGYVRHAASPLIQPFFKNLSSKSAMNLIKSLGLQYVPPLTDTRAITQKAMRVIACGPRTLLEPFCIHLYNLFNGRDHLNKKSMYHMITTHFPDSFTMRELLHFLQLAQTNVFAQFDLGSKKLNMAKYNSSTPPEYPLSRITTPMTFHYSDSDFIVSPKDMNKLVKQIANVAGVFRVPYPQFTHINFVVGSDSDKYLYTPTVQFMNTFTKTNHTLLSK